MTDIILACQAGIILDSNVYCGGGTDATQAIQSILDQAKEGKGIRLILRRRCSCKRA